MLCKHLEQPLVRHNLCYQSHLYQSTTESAEAVQLSDADQNHSRAQ